MPPVVVMLTDAEIARLRQPVTGQGGWQVLLHRLQRGLHWTGELTIHTDDLERIARAWCAGQASHGQGGFQRRLPLQSLAPFLRTCAPLFGADALALKAQRWIYVVMDTEHRIKIGGTYHPKRRGGGYRTDSADPLTLLLWLVEGCPHTERGLHARFAHLRIRHDGEWFWFGEEIKQFIADEQARAREERGA